MLLILKDFRFDTTINANVDRVRLAVARAEIYRKEIGIGLCSKVLHGKRSLDTSKDKLFPVRQDMLPRGPLTSLKIRHNDVLDRYLNQKVRVTDCYSIVSHLFLFILVAM